MNGYFAIKEWSRTVDHCLNAVLSSDILLGFLGMRAGRQASLDQRRHPKEWEGGFWKLHYYLPTFVIKNLYTIAVVLEF